jgi:hypothetical protein
LEKTPRRFIKNPRTFYSGQSTGSLRQEVKEAGGGCQFWREGGP